jgi:hypothetical protein
VCWISDQFDSSRRFIKLSTCYFTNSIDQIPFSKTDIWVGRGEIY